MWEKLPALKGITDFISLTKTLISNLTLSRFHCCKITISKQYTGPSRTLHSVPMVSKALLFIHMIEKNLWKINQNLESCRSARIPIFWIAVFLYIWSYFFLHSSISSVFCNWKYIRATWFCNSLLKNLMSQKIFWALSCLHVHICRDFDKFSFWYGCWPPRQQNITVQVPKELWWFQLQNLLNTE